MWMRKRCDEKFFEGHMVRKRGGERSGDQVTMLIRKDYQQLCEKERR
jgi:hypothetical protein